MMLMLLLFLKVSCEFSQKNTVDDKHVQQEGKSNVCFLKSEKLQFFREFTITYRLEINVDCTIFDFDPL